MIAETFIDEAALGAHGAVDASGLACEVGATVVTDRLAEFAGHGMNDGRDGDEGGPDDRQDGQGEPTDERKRGQDSRSEDGQSSKSNLVEPVQGQVLRGVGEDTG